MSHSAAENSPGPGSSGQPAVRATALRSWPQDEQDLRFEIKAVCQESTLPQLRARLRLHAAAIRTLYPPRRIQSLYFDTPNGRALNDNLAGILQREKLRLRWYGAANRGVRTVLERKVRFNRLGWKDRLELDGTWDIEGAPRHAFMFRLSKVLPPAWQALFAAALEPVQWVSYMREYYTTADGRVRLTLDSGLQAWSQTRPVLASVAPVLLPHMAIVECKAARQDEDILEELLEIFPLATDKCSKFVLASQPAAGPLVSFFDS